MSVTKFQSVDDLVLTKRNMRMFDNKNNYTKPALDYFHHDFFVNEQNNEFQQFWSLLTSSKKDTEDADMIRLPSCSLENKFDYEFYLKRLHHCIWRRWSIDLEKLQDMKIDPLSINWNKETDITVLYGPDVKVTEQGSTHLTGLFKSIDFNKDFDSSIILSNDDNDLIDEISSLSSSVDSQPASARSSIFEKSIVTPTKKKSLKFNDFVLRRDINAKGRFFEFHTYINDLF